MEKKLKIIFIGTNLFYENPQDMIKIYLSNSDCQSLNQKRDTCFEFTKNIKETKLNLKFIEIKNLDRKETIIKESDCVIVFFDLENRDSLDKLGNIISYLQVSASLEKKVYIIGKYHNEEDKDANLSEDEMLKYLNGKKMLYDYMELCTKEVDDVVKIIDFIILESYEIKVKIQKDSKKSLKSSDKSTSGCIIN
jgi:hypothetical protein